MKLQQILFLALCAVNQVMPSAPAGMATTAAAASTLTPVAPAVIQIPHLTEFDPRVEAFLKATYLKQFSDTMENVLQKSPHFEQETAERSTIEEYNAEYLRLIDLALLDPNPLLAFHYLWHSDKRKEEFIQDYHRAFTALMCLSETELSDSELHKRFDQFIQNHECSFAPIFLDRKTKIGNVVYDILGELNLCHVPVAVIPTIGLCNAYAILDRIIFIESGLITPAAINSGMLAGILAHEAQHIANRDETLRQLHPRTIAQLNHLKEMRADILGALQGPKFFNGLAHAQSKIPISATCSHPSSSQRLAALSKLYTELTTPYEQLIKQTITK
jgi:Zn-dependent protease with chaperone function